MDLFPLFVMSVLKAAVRPQERRGKMWIIIRRPHAYLEAELGRAFQGQRDVQVVVDRRSGERRIRAHPVAVERRGADRRSPREDLVEILISG